MCILKWHVLGLARVKSFLESQDSDLKFDQHISDLCNEVSKIINALCQIRSCMSLEKRRIVIETFVKSKLSYCHLIWMLDSRMLNYKIYRLYERALIIVYSDYKS